MLIQYDSGFPAPNILSDNQYFAKVPNKLIDKIITSKLNASEIKTALVLLGLISSNTAKAGRTIAVTTYADIMQPTVDGKRQIILREGFQGDIRTLRRSVKKLINEKLFVRMTMRSVSDGSGKTHQLPTCYRLRSHLDHTEWNGELYVTGTALELSQRVTTTIPEIQQCIDLVETKTSEKLSMIHVFFIFISQLLPVKECSNNITVSKIESLLNPITKTFPMFEDKVNAIKKSVQHSNPSEEKKVNTGDQVGESTHLLSDQVGESTHLLSDQVGESTHQVWSNNFKSEDSQQNCSIGNSNGNESTHLVDDRTKEPIHSKKEPIHSKREPIHPQKGMDSPIININKEKEDNNTLHRIRRVLDKKPELGYKTEKGVCVISDKQKNLFTDRHAKIIIDHASAFDHLEPEIVLSMLHHQNFDSPIEKPTRLLIHIANHGFDPDPHFIDMLDNMERKLSVEKIDQITIDPNVEKTILATKQMLEEFNFTNDDIKRFLQAHNANKLITRTISSNTKISDNHLVINEIINISNVEQIPVGMLGYLIEDVLDKPVRKNQNG